MTSKTKSPIDAANETNASITKALNDMQDKFEIPEAARWRGPTKKRPACASPSHLKLCPQQTYAACLETFATLAKPSCTVL